MHLQYPVTRTALMHRTHRYSLSTLITDEPETAEELEETLTLELQSQPAMTSGNLTENVVIVLLKFEIMEVQQQIPWVRCKLFYTASLSGVYFWAGSADAE